MVAGLLSIGLGLSVSTAGASGETTTAVLTSPLSGSSTTFTWTYTFLSNDGHDLSNLAVKFCSSDLLSHVVSSSPSGETFLDTVPGGHPGFGPGIKFDATAVTGSIQVVFDQAYAAAPAGMTIESHSGDGTDGDIPTTADGPAGCDPLTTTTTIAATTTTEPVTTTTQPVTTTTQPVTTTTQPVTTTTQPVTTTTVVLGTTIPIVTTTNAPPVSATVPVSVLGLRFSRPDPSLATTGSDKIGPLVALGAIAALMGLALLVGDRVSAGSNSGRLN